MIKSRMYHKILFLCLVLALNNTLAQRLAKDKAGQFHGDEYYETGNEYYSYEEPHKGNNYVCTGCPTIDSYKSK